MRLAFAIVLTGCGYSAGEPIEIAPVPDLEPPPVHVVGGSAPVSCAGAGGLTIVPRGPVQGSWDRHRPIAGEGTALVRWCGAGRVRLLLVRAGTDVLDAAGEVAIDHGRQVAVAVAGVPGDGRSELVAVVVDADGERPRATGWLTSVDDPERAAARAACVTCGGEWNWWGMGHVELCNCPTTDAGKRCNSDGDCEGDCLETGWEPIAATPETCPSGQRTELRVGRCDGRRFAHGCVVWTDRMTRCAPVPGP